ncbi:MAG: hypothetical protein PUA69_06205 [Erysipelotrichaceae bacterium]|nr:hypothetical protein [Erysipelotrichaceae bacterium]
MLADIVRYLHLNPDWLFYEDNEVSVLKDDLRKRDSREQVAGRAETLMQGTSKRNYALETGIHYQVLMKIIGNTDADVIESVISKIADR